MEIKYQERCGTRFSDLDRGGRLPSAGFLRCSAAVDLFCRGASIATAGGSAEGIATPWSGAAEKPMRLRRTFAESPTLINCSDRLLAPQ